MSSDARALKPLPLLCFILESLQLPVCLALSFVTQKRKSTWPRMITHFAVNGLSLFPLIAVILR